LATLGLSLLQLTDNLVTNQTGTHHMHAGYPWTISH